MNLEKGPRRLLVAEPRGLCAGVVRSLEAYDKALESNLGKTLYSVGEPAHNTHINRRFKEKGVIFVDSMSEVPLGGIALLGPHGTEVQEYEEAQRRELSIWDTTCPLVTKVEDEIKLNTENGIVTIFWGDPNHQEAKAAISSGDVVLVKNKKEALSDEVKDKTINKKGVAFATQTTFNADEALEIEEALEEKYPGLVIARIPDRCYATRNRQLAVKEMIRNGATKIGVLGSDSSSNSKRLFEVAQENGADAVFFDSADILSKDVFLGYEVVGLVSGASVEEERFQEVLKFFRNSFNLEPESIVVADEKRIKFAGVKFEPQFIYNG